LVEVGRNINIELLTLSELTQLEGQAGDFTATLTRHPRRVSMEKCISCGLCAEKCPKKVANAYDEGLSQRKAIYIDYPQAVPLKYSIDPDQCLYILKKRCKLCEKICPTGAIDFEEPATQARLHVGAVILTLGSQAYDPGKWDTYGYKKSKNIVTSLEFERLVSASGPYAGHLVRPHDDKVPKKIAWLNCIGSRDEHIGAHGYCSGVCCTNSIKGAIMAKDHIKTLDAAIFYIDIRTYGKDLERYYNYARNDLGVRFIKSKITSIEPINTDGNHVLRYIDAFGQTMEEAFDMVVLSVGLMIPEKSTLLARDLDIEVNAYGFAQTTSFLPVQTSRPGVYVCGAFQSPKTIPTSVIDASAASGMVGCLLSESRWNNTKTLEVVSETDIRGEAPRTGVFVCCCGTNIAAYVDVPAVVEYARTLPYVVFAQQNLFSCSQDTQDEMAQTIKDQRLNRVVVAACTPKTHEPLFQNTVAKAGLNKYLFEMANIRNQCSWVHQSDMSLATAKAKDLVKMAAAKAMLSKPLAEPKMTVNQQALIVGGGVAGLEAAKTLSQQGYVTYIIEKSGHLGGQTKKLYKTWKGEFIKTYFDQLMEDVNDETQILYWLNAEILEVEGAVGNFRTTICSNGQKRVLDHGVVIIASGASQYLPTEHLYGKSSRVMTSLELEEAFTKNMNFESHKTIAFIQCVGSRNDQHPYCSKICCTQSIKNAILFKEMDPKKEIYILYRDIRSYGMRENLYRTARQMGIHFIRYNHNKRLNVTQNNGMITLEFTDIVFRREMIIETDLLVLAAAVTAPEKNPLAKLFKLSQNADHFFAEAHVKLRPNDFATDGMFLCGLAHGPKTVGESIAQAQAAAARAVTILSKKSVSLQGTVAYVNPAYCSKCGICVSICPYYAPMFNFRTKKAQIQHTLCKGCGLCVASCRSGAINLNGFETSEIMDMVKSIL
ncbi:MAG: FAD-dependent oxidoreductase, partial [Proteobacteria bacterium]|nr:FAD-dependent oxidoreductase [Pseudomonadota bacterium]